MLNEFEAPFAKGHLLSMWREFGTSARGVDLRVAHMALLHNNAHSLPRPTSHLSPAIFISMGPLARFISLFILVHLALMMCSLLCCDVGGGRVNFVMVPPSARHLTFP